eukprot:m.1148035 g.1148035  ORF g.1148035 m.1148035 type:complete len:52 (+) comp24472_c0_seq2:3761-3916(+)
MCFWRLSFVPTLEISQSVGVNRLGEVWISGTVHIDNHVECNGRMENVLCTH